MSNHTKGPWRRAGNVIWGDKIQKQVAMISKLPRNPGESTALEESANARLIASAPEMLEMLKALSASTAVLNHLDFDDNHALMELIAKAEGRGE